MERDRLRERERQARAAMSVQAEQAAAGGGPDTRHHHHGHHNHAHHHVNPHAVTAPLFRAPVRVSLRSDFILTLFLPRTVDRSLDTRPRFPSPDTVRDQIKGSCAVKDAVSRDTSFFDA